MPFVLVIHCAEEGGYWAKVPALPGSFVQGETIEELLTDAPDAIGSQIEALRGDGQPVPHDGRVGPPQPRRSASGSVRRGAMSAARCW